MTYTNIVKEEMLSKEVKTIEDFYSILLGVFLSKNAITNEGIFYKTENYELAKYLIYNIKKFTQINIKISYKKSRRFKEHNEYILNIESKDKHYSKFINNILKYKDLTNAENEIKKNIIIGFFIASAYIKNPSRGYSLDFFIDSEDAATFLYLFIKKIGNTKVSITQKNKKNIVYIRNNECILDILALVQAYDNFFKYQNVVLEKEIKNNIIRSMNYEIANETKKLNTINKTLDMIEYIDDNYGISNLSDSLYELCKFRIEYDDMSLQELADKMGLTKSGVRGRMKRLEKIYLELKEGNNE